jgi:hypothetical protein
MRLTAGESLVEESGIVIQKQFDRIEKTDIESLVANAVEEGRTIEYKHELPGGKDAEKKEFLADVSSFANASGGDLLFGVEEQRGTDGKPTGIPAAVPGVAVQNADAEIRRLENIIRDGIRPRIAGIYLRTVDGFANGPVLLIRIQKSYAAPHMVTFQEHSRFYSRNSRGKYALDVGEIRSAFALSESLPERIRRFRDERLVRIVAGETPMPLNEGPKVVLHVLPFDALDPTTHVNLEQVARRSEKLCPMYSSGWDSRYNFDGYLCHNTKEKPRICHSYAQFLRSGAIEAVDARILINDNGDRLFPAPAVERELIEAVERYLTIYKALQIEPPIVLMVSLLGVRAYYITGGAFRDLQGSFDRDSLLLPDLLIEDLAADLPSLFKPAFDAMWQASGWSRCFDYNGEGKWADSRQRLDVGR